MTLSSLTLPRVTPSPALAQAPPAPPAPRGREAPGAASACEPKEAPQPRGARTTGGAQLGWPAPDSRRADAAWLKAAPLVFVMNAGAGASAGQTEATRETITRLVREAGRVPHIVLVHDGADLARCAHEGARKARELDGVLVAVGGDGSINVVAAAALEADVPLGVIPQGTFNYFGRSLGISDELEPALRTLLDPCLCSLRPGRVGSVGEGPRRLFLVSASLGFYPQIIEDREHWKQQFGRRRIVALWSGLITLLGRHRTLHLALRGADGHTKSIRTSTLLVSDNALQMAQLGLPEAHAIRDGQLAALVVRVSSRWQLLALALRGALKTLGDDERLLHFAFERLEVAVRRPVPGHRFKVAIDGEIVPHASPLVFDVSPQPLLVLVPWPDAISAEAREAGQAWRDDLAVAAYRSRAG